MTQTKARAAGRPTLTVKPPAPAVERSEQPSNVALAGAPMAQAEPVSWSDEDETALRTLMVRRKAAGYRARGRDVGSQLLSVGQIKPNPETIAATIVSLIGSRASIKRSDLLDLMASATFPHPRAKPQDKGWCQGYVAGLIRSGFLAAAKEDATGVQAA